MNARPRSRGLTVGSPFARADRVARLTLCRGADPLAAAAGLRSRGACLSGRSTTRAALGPLEPPTWPVGAYGARLGGAGGFRRPGARRLRRVANGLPSAPADRSVGARVAHGGLGGRTFRRVGVRPARPARRPSSPSGAT